MKTSHQKTESVYVETHTHPHMLPTRSLQVAMPRASHKIRIKDTETFAHCDLMKLGCILFGKKTLQRRIQQWILVQDALNAGRSS